MLLFALPMTAGNILQQFYNIADTLIVGKFLGAGALAAVGASYALMIFLTSILLGLCMGSGALFSIRYGEKNIEKLKSSIFVSFFLIAGVTIIINKFYENTGKYFSNDKRLSLDNFYRYRIYFFI